VATMAHWAMDGYSSDMAASRIGCRTMLGFTDLVFLEVQLPRHVSSAKREARRLEGTLGPPLLERNAQTQNRRSRFGCVEWSKEAEAVETRTGV
jgi:hypothetical protein